MNKNIWHTKDEIPSQESRVFWKSGNLVYGGRFDAHYKCFCGPASQFVDLKKVSCWCYIDDFLALETENKDLSDKIGKLELELERTRKALDKAKKENEDKQAVLNCVVDMLKTLNQKYALIMGKDVIKETVRLLEQNKGGDNE